jgi:hypothetical protein
MAVSKFERFFRLAASLDVDKNDIKRYADFVNQKIYDLLLMGVATANANDRDIAQPWDLPITKGLQENIHAFRKLDAETGLEDVLERLAAWPPLELALADETTVRLPEIAGGISVCLAQAFTIVDPDVKNPKTVLWERTFGLFDLLRSRGVAPSLPLSVAGGDVLLEVLPHLFEVLPASLVHPDHRVRRPVEGADQLIELQLDRPVVVVLRVLDDDEQHEREHGQSRGSHELPAPGEAEHPSRDEPGPHGDHDRHDRPRRPRQVGDVAGAASEGRGLPGDVVRCVRFLAHSRLLPS